MRFRRRQLRFDCGLFDILGRRVGRILDEHRAAGTQFMTWNGSDAFGRKAGTGIYFIRVKTPDFLLSSKVHLIGR
jgi:hypothetical protein